MLKDLISSILMIKGKTVILYYSIVLYLVQQNELFMLYLKNKLNELKRGKNHNFHYG